MIKTATTLFDFAQGIKEPPSDPAHIESIRLELATAIAKLATCDPESKLAVAKHVARCLNATSREFNVAVFVVEKQEGTKELPLESQQEIEL